jgi:hypothetical protein
LPSSDGSGDSANSSALYRLLRALGDVGIVVELEDRRFALIPVGELLRSDVNETSSQTVMTEHEMPDTDETAD